MGGSEGGEGMGRASGEGREGEGKGERGAATAGNFVSEFTVCASK